MRIYEKPVNLQRQVVLRMLIDEYYEHEAAGGNLHIVLDDGNIEDGHIEWCLERAKENNDVFGTIIAEQLLLITEEEREQLLERYYEVFDELMK